MEVTTISSNTLIKIDCGGDSTIKFIVEGWFKSGNKIFIIAKKTAKSILCLYELSDEFLIYISVFQDYQKITFHRANPGNKIAVNDIEGVKMNLKKLPSIIEGKTFKWKSSQ